MRKLLIKILLVIMMITATFFVGCQCGGDGDGPQGSPGIPPSPPPATIELKAENDDLMVGDFSKVTPTNYTTVEGQSLVYASSNPNVVKVFSDGTIEAISQGSAIISVTYGEAKDQIPIKSSFRGLTPQLLIDGLLTRNISNVDTDQINPYVFFNGRRFGFDEGLTVEYTSMNTDLVTVNSSGLVSGVAGAKGIATIVVKASWRGFDGATTFSLQKEIEYSVGVNTVFMINGNTAKSYEVYTKAEFGGQNYENVKDFVCTATYGEETIETSDITVTISNEEMASYSNGKLTGKTFGEDGKTTAILSFVKEGFTYSKIVPITVVRPIASYADRIKYFSILTGHYIDESDGFKDKSVTQTIFGSDEIVDVYQGDRRLVVDGKGNIIGTDEDGKIITVEGNFDCVADVTLRIGTQTERYDVSLDVYTKVIQNAKDVENTFKIEKAGTYVTGYCEMINDVDMTGVSFSHKAYTSAPNDQKNAKLGGFRGVFNGNGYTINNFSTGAGGLFLYTHAYEGNNPVIKNVGFNNVKFSTSASAVVRAAASPTQFENIYIKVANDNTGLVQGALLTQYGEANVKMKNIFIDVPSTLTINPETDGSDGTENKHVLDDQGGVKATGNSKYGFGSLFGELS
ncbi:MAG: hypothetical protein J6R29_05350, partial [Clostridia bacterium]|nr:hypothetical protein [Clostridia bacterium]